MPEGEDRSQFLSLYLEIQPSLRSYLLALLRDADDMEDVFQEVSMVLWKRFDDYDQAHPFAHWAMGIARNHAARWRRAGGRRPAWLSPEVEKQLADTYQELEEELSDRRRALSVCVEKLGGKARELLALRYEKKYSLQRIADLRQRSLNAVNKSLGKIRRFLARCAELAGRANGQGLEGAGL